MLLFVKTKLNSFGLRALDLAQDQRVVEAERYLVACMERMEEKPADRLTAEEKSNSSDRTGEPPLQQAKDDVIKACSTLRQALGTAIVANVTSSTDQAAMVLLLLCIFKMHQFTGANVEAYQVWLPALYASRRASLAVSSMSNSVCFTAGACVGNSCPGHQ